jgi:hypothetical protein
MLTTIILVIATAYTAYHRGTRIGYTRGVTIGRQSGDVYRSLFYNNGIEGLQYQEGGE